MAQKEAFFSESEVYQALSWGMPDSDAIRLAKHMSDDPDVSATIQGLRDAGPVVTMYSDDFLLLLSLVSEETNRKVERRLLETRRGKELSSEERARWQERRRALKSELVKAGKIRE